MVLLENWVRFVPELQSERSCCWSDYGEFRMAANKGFAEIFLIQQGGVKMVQVYRSLRIL